MPTSNFLQWDPSLINAETDAEYAADSLRSGGAPVDAVFPSATANKGFYQWSTMAAAIAAYMVAQGQNAEDSNLATLAANFAAAISAQLRPTLGWVSGSNAGDYGITAPGENFVDVDSTNLTFTVTVPVGWKLLVMAQGSSACGTDNPNSEALYVGIHDSIANAQIAFNALAPTYLQAFSLIGALQGDGAVHTIRLQWTRTGGGSNSFDMKNIGGLVPTMTFFLTPSN